MGEASLFMLFSNRCPHCGKAPVFASFLQMYRRCPACGFAYERESGQHWGAMVMSYAFGAFISFPLFFVLILRHAPVLACIGIPTLVLACVAPFSVRFSRLAWMHIMYAAHPPKDGENP
jgi:uncharacterized protein (DUF983 family)